MKNKKMFAARIVMTALSVGAVCFIFCNSLMSADDSAEQSGDIMEFINRLLCSLNIDFSVTDFMVRKAAHFTEFTILGALLCVTFYLYFQKRLPSFISAFPTGALVGVCDEFIQTTSQGRSCELRDMTIDASGALLGVLIVLLIITIIIRKRNKKLILEGEKDE